MSTTIKGFVGLAFLKEALEAEGVAIAAPSVHEATAAVEAAKVTFDRAEEAAQEVAVKVVKVEETISLLNKEEGDGVGAAIAKGQELLLSLARQAKCAQKALDKAADELDRAEAALVVALESEAVAASVAAAAKREEEKREEKERVASLVSAAEELFDSIS